MNADQHFRTRKPKFRSGKFYIRNPDGEFVHSVLFARNGTWEISCRPWQPSLNPLTIRQAKSLAAILGEGFTVHPEQPVIPLTH